MRARDRDPWWTRAKCKDYDPADFEPKRLPSGRHRRADAGVKNERDWSVARQICGMCPVRQECFVNALNQQDTLLGSFEEMFVAGYTPEEMRAFRARRRQLKPRRAS